jgi:hypothetical protein
MVDDGLHNLIKVIIIVDNLSILELKLIQHDIINIIPYLGRQEIVSGHDPPLPFHCQRWPAMTGAHRFVAAVGFRPPPQKSRS